MRRGAPAPVMALLRTWGYQDDERPGDRLDAARSGRAVYYRAGMRRAALALAGDLGLRAEPPWSATRARPRRSR